MIPNHPPFFDVDGFGSNLSYQTQTAQGYRNCHSKSLFASDNSKPFTTHPSSRPSALPQALVAPLAQVGPHPLHSAILTLENGADLRLDGLVFVQQPLIGHGTCVLCATATRKWNTKEDAQFRPAEHLKREENQYGNRVLQILVMTELFPITKLKTSHEFAPAIRNIFESYRLLYEHTKVIHGDISLHSLKCRKVDGKIYGVLIDYDLPLFFKKSKQGPSTKQRMGTMSYMALDLILPTLTKHLYRHDLESQFLTFRPTHLRYGSNSLPSYLLRHRTSRRRRPTGLNGHYDEHAAPLASTSPILSRATCYATGGEDPTDAPRVRQCHRIERTLRRAHYATGDDPTDAPRV